MKWIARLLRRRAPRGGVVTPYRPKSDTVVVRIPPSQPAPQIESAKRQPGKCPTCGK